KQSIHEVLLSNCNEDSSFGRVGDGSSSERRHLWMLTSKRKEHVTRWLPRDSPSKLGQCSDLCNNKSAGRSSSVSPSPMSSSGCCCDRRVYPGPCLWVRSSPRR